MTRVVQHQFHCQNGHTFVAPELPGTYGGDLLARSPAPRSELLIPGFDSPILGEAEALFREQLVSQLNDAELGMAFQGMLSVVVDPDVDGARFEVGRLPTCPVCGATEIEWWDQVEPPEFGDIDLPIATHRGWDALSSTEKRSRVSEFLRARGYETR